MEDSLIIINIVISALTLLFGFLTLFIKQLKHSNCCKIIEVDMKSSRDLNNSSS